MRMKRNVLQASALMRTRHLAGPHPFSHSRAVCRDVMVPRLISLLTTGPSIREHPLYSRSVRLACLLFSLQSMGCMLLRSLTASSPPWCLNVAYLGTRR